MKVPLSWLRELVDIDLTVDELVDVMNANGLEVEEVTRPGSGTSGVHTARVTHREPHPDADKLQFVRVSDGESELEVVCGAWNFAEGDVILHAPPGATIPGGMTLEARKLRGIVSNGMILSARELEVADDHTGIMVLPEDTPLGVDVHDLLPLGEPVIDVAVQADRGDHHSILGIARDLAAILGTDLRVPAVPEPSGEGPVPIEIEATDGCSHYVGWAVEDVTVGPSPWWLRQRLEACGIRSINNVVDVTNYVLLEFGQPLHGFDLDRIHGPRIVVRWAQPSERLVTLDDKERVLEEGDLVIADADRGIALAGVMGGADTEVGESTTRVLLEAAIFDAGTVRRTSRRLHLVSEASMRFARRVDPAGAQRAAARAADLLADLAGGRGAGVTSAGSPEVAREAVAYDTARFAAFLGLPELSGDEQADLLRRVGCEVSEAGDGVLEVVAPSWRGDLVRPADLAEEVARLYGYDRIPAMLPPVAQRGGLTPAQQAERSVGDAARAGGFHEAQTRPFVGDDVLLGAVPDDGRVELANPLAKDASRMRPSLLEGLLAAVRRNVGQGRPGVALYEYGRIFRPAGGPLDDVLGAFGDRWRWLDDREQPLPTQPRTIGFAAQGLRGGEQWLAVEDTWSVEDVLAVCDEVVARLAPPDDDSWVLERCPTEREGFHPGRTATLHLRGHEVGIVGQLHPDESARRDLPEPVVLGELLVEPLLEHVAAGLPPAQATTLVKHPAMTVDVALVADESVSYDQLVDAIRAGAGDLLDAYWFFDEYRGEQVGEGKRSVAIRLRLQAPERQLSDEDADQVIAAIGREAEIVGAALRR